jgi:hypothetical protein
VRADCAVVAYRFPALVRADLAAARRREVVPHRRARRERLHHAERKARVAGVDHPARLVLAERGLKRREHGVPGLEEDLGPPELGRVRPRRLAPVAAGAVASDGRANDANGAVAQGPVLALAVARAVPHLAASPAPAHGRLKAPGTPRHGTGLIKMRKETEGKKKKKKKKNFFFFFFFCDSFLTPLNLVTRRRRCACPEAPATRPGNPRPRFVSPRRTRPRSPCPRQSRRVPDPLCRAGGTKPAPRRGAPR